MFTGEIFVSHFSIVLDIIGKVGTPTKIDEKLHLELLFITVGVHGVKKCYTNNQQFE